MPNRVNPISLEVLGEVDYTQFETDFQKLAQRITKDDQARQTWVTNVGEIENQLKGQDKRKNKPWRHAAELSIPLTKKLLRRWTPTLYNLVAFADPLCHFKANDLASAVAAPTAEEFFNWLVREYMDDVLTEIRYLIYDIGAKGTGYLGVGWDYRSELETRIVPVGDIWPNGPPADVGQLIMGLVQEYDLAVTTPELQQQLIAVAQKILAGAPFVKITYRRTVADKPRLTRYDPYNVIVPPKSGFSHEAPYVCIVHDFTEFELRQRALDGLLNAQAVDKLIKDRGERAAKEETTAADGVKQTQLQAAGIQDEPDDLNVYRVYQVYCLLDTNGDGIGERCILWYAPGSEPVRLALHDFPFSFRYWPVFRFDYESVDRRPYINQGMGHHLKDIQQHYNKQYRATSDAIDIQLAPVFQKRLTSKLQPRTFLWGPGSVIDVQQIGDIGPVEKSPLNLHEYLQDRGELKAFAEEMVGSIDAALAATGRRLERRTAFEVQQVAGQIEAVQGMDSAIFQTSMGKAFQCIWEMWLDLGPDMVYYQVTKEQQPKPFKKSEHNYRYQLTPSGTPGNTNRNSELQRVTQLMQLFMQWAPDLVNRTFVIGYIARLLDSRLASQVLLPEAQQQFQTMLQQLAAATARGELPEAMKMIISNSPGGGQATP